MVRKWHHGAKPNFSNIGFPSRNLRISIWFVEAPFCAGLSVGNHQGRPKTWVVLQAPLSPCRWTGGAIATAAIRVLERIGLDKAPKLVMG